MDCIKWYEIVPKGSYRVRRNCAGCGKKTWYQNTHCFRINANGTKLDVWLIYQCEVCGHTYNLTVWERVRASAIGSDYERYQSNDPILAEQYGNDRAFFERNRAEIESRREYDIKEVKEEQKIELFQEIIQKRNDLDNQKKLLCYYNPALLPVRVDKLLAELFGKSRAWIQKAGKSGDMVISEGFAGKLMVVLVSEHLLEYLFADKE